MTARDPSGAGGQENASRDRYIGGPRASKPTDASPAVPLAPALYIVATPIGNLRDVTLRALDVLAGADRIACEDTRVTSRLLAAYGIETSLEAYHDHNAARVRPKLLDRVAAGEAVALVSDAGTPLISDPGYKLVAEAAARGLPVVPIPGASAMTAALAAAGLPSDRFLFAGFPPPKPGRRKTWLAETLRVPATLVLYEAPSRLAATLAALAEIDAERPVAVMRELTKRHEEHRRDTAAALAAHYAEAGPPKGEVVLVIGPPETETASAGDVDAMLRDALASLSVKDAARAVAEASGRPKKQIYARALELAKDGGR